MKILVPALAAVMLIGAVATATPAEARCWWNGYNWQCSQRYQQSYHPSRYQYRYQNRYHDDWRHSGGGWRHDGREYYGRGYNR